MAMAFVKAGIMYYFTGCQVTFFQGVTARLVEDRKILNTPFESPSKMGLSDALKRQI
jgi:hypothetical protein